MSLELEFENENNYYERDQLGKSNDEKKWMFKYSKYFVHLISYEWNNYSKANLIVYNMKANETEQRNRRRYQSLCLFANEALPSNSYAWIR